VAKRNGGLFFFFPPENWQHHASLPLVSVLYPPLFRGIDLKIDAPFFPFPWSENGDARSSFSPPSPSYISFFRRMLKGIPVLSSFFPLQQEDTYRPFPSPLSLTLLASVSPDDYINKDLRSSLLSLFLFATKRVDHSPPLPLLFPKTGLKSAPLFLQLMSINVSLPFSLLFFLPS